MEKRVLPPRGITIIDVERLLERRRGNTQNPLDLANVLILRHDLFGQHSWRRSSCGRVQQQIGNTLLFAHDRIPNSAEIRIFGYETLALPVDKNTLLPR